MVLIHKRTHFYDYYRSNVQTIFSNYFQHTALHNRVSQSLRVTCIGLAV